MLREKSDIHKFEKLNDSLKRWSNETRNQFDYSEYTKETGTLYRFGWFHINGYKYSISGWKFRDDIVTFENEDTGEKIKYDIIKNDVLNKKFTKDTFIQSKFKKIRIKISVWLRTLSDKLQP